MKRTLQILLMVFILNSCQNSVQEADEYILNEFSNQLSDEIDFFISTADFLYYANPSNYWYPEEYTFQDILDDKFRYGYKEISRLKEEIDALPTNDPELTNAVSELSELINSSLRDIRKKQQAIEDMDGMFGMMSFGGLSGLMELDNALSTPEERRKREEESRAMPKSIKVGLEKLTDMLFSKHRAIADKMYEFEKSVFEISEPSLEEKEQIRSNLKDFIKDYTLLQFYGLEIESYEKMLELLINHYHNEYPLNTN